MSRFDFSDIMRKREVILKAREERIKEEVEDDEINENYKH